MSGKIVINNLRSIRFLDFEMPGTGVWLLTAGNGAGKTTLLACIRRIGDSTAFQTHFPASLNSDRLDNHLEGSIEYEVNDEKVEYAYRGERWTPRPRTNSKLLDEFGYPSVTYIGATAERITPRSEDFQPNRIRPAPQPLIQAANEIFETSKFDNLKKVNLTTGTGNEAFVMSLGGAPAKYHSERHFSLGELCVLKLLKLLRGVQNNSLIVIDELEMALHPKAQVRLVQHLQKEANRKRLTIIFSTHSSTILKSVNKNCIIFLERQNDGVVVAINGCYPTYALGSIAYEEEAVSDAVIYVEDEFARQISIEMFRKFVSERYNNPANWPSVKFAPIGGFYEVVKFLDQSQTILPPQCRQSALLDEDVVSEVVEKWRDTDAFVPLQLFQKWHNKISYLPWTPEVGICKDIVDDIEGYEIFFRARFADNQIRILNAVRNFDTTLNGRPLRSSAKQAIRNLISYLHQKTGVNEAQIRADIASEFGRRVWPNVRADFMQIFGANIA